MPSLSFNTMHDLMVVSGDSVILRNRKYINIQRDNILLSPDSIYIYEECSVHVRD